MMTVCLTRLLVQVATQDELRGVVAAAGEPLLLLLRSTLREAKTAQEVKSPDPNS
jgi:hypothetical protein